LREREGIGSKRSIGKPEGAACSGVKGNRLPKEKKKNGLRGKKETMSLIIIHIEKFFARTKKKKKVQHDLSRISAREGRGGEKVRGWSFHGKLCNQSRRTQKRGINLPGEADGENRENNQQREKKDRA